MAIALGAVINTSIGFAGAALFGQAVATLAITAATSLALSALTPSQVLKQ